MELKDAIGKRRAYRSLDPVKIDEKDVKDLASFAQLAPSCFNRQPWNFVFVYDSEKLKELHSALSKGNEWAHYASMIIAVFSNKQLDCDIKGREYYLFDTGLAVAFLILRATDLGFVAHPIAGFSEIRVKEILKIPEEMQVISLVVIGKHSDKINELLNEQQAESEKERPERFFFEKYCHLNEFKE